MASSLSRIPIFSTNRSNRRQMLTPSTQSTVPRVLRFRCSAGQAGFFTRLGRLIKEKAKSDVDKLFSGFYQDADNLAVIDELLLYWNWLILIACLTRGLEECVLDLLTSKAHKTELQLGSGNRCDHDSWSEWRRKDDVPWKLAYRLKKEGAKRTDCEIIMAEKANAKAPSGLLVVISQAVKKGKDDGFDIVLMRHLWTFAHKLQPHGNLIACKKAVSKVITGAPNEILLVLDGTTGLNMLPQAREFNEVVGITGLILTKLDGTARGGCVVSVVDELGIQSNLLVLVKLKNGGCIAEAICASSTDNHPEESIDNTLIQSDELNRETSYWSSEKVYIQPFQGFLSYKTNGSVRFRMGHPKYPLNWTWNMRRLDELTDEDFVWNYTSPEFPMLQERSLQKFQLPEPVLCIGGYLKIELLGRVQRQDSDGMYYICVSHVRADGMSLSPKFTVKILRTLQNWGKFGLEYNPHAVIIPPNDTCTSIIEFRDEEAPGHQNWGQFMNMLQAYNPGEDEDENMDGNEHEEVEFEYINED
ncbi:unnamed protein product [Rhodiola kirilowii]